MVATPPCALPTPASAVGSRSPPSAPALRVPVAELRAARDRLPRPPCAMALRSWPRNIERFHAVEVPPAEQWVNVAPGIEVGRVWRGLDRVAAYVPGGTAAYPSSLLMSAIPARLAGVGSYVVASPASAGRPALARAAGRRGAHGGGRVLGHGRRPGRGCPRLRHRVDRARGQDRGSRQRLGHGGQAGGPGPLRHRHAGRPDRGHGRGRRQRPTRSTWPPTCSARPSTGPTPLPCW